MPTNIPSDVDVAEFLSTDLGPIAVAHLLNLLVILTVKPVPDAWRDESIAAARAFAGVVAHRGPSEPQRVAGDVARYVPTSLPS